MKKIALAALLLTGWAGTALASSYDDLNAGIQYYNLGQWQAAIDAFDKALAAGDLAPSLLFIAHYDRGRSHLHFAQFDQAVADYSASLALRPGETQVLLDRSLAYLNAGKLDLAMTDLDGLIAAHPMLTSPYGMRATVYIKRGEMDKSREDMKTLLKLLPDNLSSRIKTGIAKWEIGQISEAEDDFWHDVSHGLSNIYAWLWYALTQAREGKSVPRRGLPDYDLAKWPGPIVNFFLGGAEQEAVFATARQGSGEQVRGQVCEANFYIGEWLAQHHDPAGAKPLMAKAASDCPINFIEWSPAQMDLAGLP